jgi:hypothetical protein
MLPQALAHGAIERLSAMTIKREPTTSGGSQPEAQGGSPTRRTT